MRLLKVRKNFATNSSSSHSVVRMKDGLVAGDYQEFLDDDFYGRYDFTLVSLEEKLRYVATYYKDKEDVSHLPDPLEGIDHESQRLFGNLSLQEAVDYVSQPSVMILGGSDEDEGHPLILFGHVVVERYSAYHKPQSIYE